MKLWLRLRRWWIEREHRLSRAVTLRNARTGRVETYVVCVDCGQEFEYDLGTMRLTGRVIRRPAQAPDSVAIERAWQDQAAAAHEDETTTSNAAPRLLKAGGARRIV